MRELIDLINGQSSSEEITFPTEWRPVDAIRNTEVRQTGEDIFELRSSSHFISITAEAFNLYRTNKAKFEKWLEDNNIDAMVRDDK